MKAIQLRSPYHIYFSKTDLDRVVFELFEQDTPEDNATLIFTLNSKAINEKVSVEVAELFRDGLSDDILQTRDTTKWLTIKAKLYDDDDNLIGFDYQFLVSRDGYIERTEDFQIYNNLVSQDFSEWTASGLTISSEVEDYFDEDNAFNIESSSGGTLTQSVDNGLYTFGVFVKRGKSANEIVVGQTRFDVPNKVVLISGDLAFDIRELENDWYYLEVYREVTNQEIKIELLNIANQDFDICFPLLRQGKKLRSKPTDLILQSNFKFIIPENESYKISFDGAYANSIYQVATENQAQNILGKNQVQTFEFNSELFFLDYEDLDASLTTTNANFKFICEQKYTPNKVSFINKFGVVQDLWMFKNKRETLTTEEDTYKRKVVQDGVALSSLGQETIFNKNSNLEVILSSGFYPEDFNQTFKELFQSQQVWINNEPVKIKDKNLQLKTKLNEKLINYVVNFEYANPEINNLR